MGIPNSVRILYKTSHLTESYAFLKPVNSEGLLHFIPIFVRYLRNADYMNGSSLPKIIPVM